MESYRLRPFGYSLVTPLYILVVLALGCIVKPTMKPGDFIIQYPHASDSFLVRVTDLTGDAGLHDTINIVYYVDESLKSGKQTEIMIEKHRSSLLQKRYAFVGIAHFGYFRSKRRRDFISPSIKTEKGFVGRNGNYGQADTFYQLLKNRITPTVEEKFSGHPIRRSFIGHSLGGLFATYLLVSNDSLFEKLYALSPSLWIDDYHLLDYESLQKARLMNVRKDIWISCGSAETLNRIKGCVQRMEDTLKIRKYPGIRFSVKIYDGKTHNSSVGSALDEIFKRF